MELFSGWLGSDSEIVVTISAAYRVEIYRASQKYPREIIVKFPYWNIKSTVLEAYWEQPNLTIGVKESSIFTDLFPVTF